MLNETRGFKKLIGNNQQLITNWFLEKGYYFVSLEQLYYETMSFSIPGIVILDTPGSLFLPFILTLGITFFIFLSK